MTDINHILLQDAGKTYLATDQISKQLLFL
jgi:hypothetical protein